MESVGNPFKISEELAEGDLVMQDLYVVMPMFSKDGPDPISKTESSPTCLDRVNFSVLLLFSDVDLLLQNDEFKTYTDLIKGFLSSEDRKSRALDALRKDYLETQSTIMSSDSGETSEDKDSHQVINPISAILMEWANMRYNEILEKKLLLKRAPNEESGYVFSDNFYDRALEMRPGELEFCFIGKVKRKFKFPEGKELNGYVFKDIDIDLSRRLAGIISKENCQKYSDIYLKVLKIDLDKNREALMESITDLRELTNIYKVALSQYPSLYDETVSTLVSGVISCDEKALRENFERLDFSVMPNGDKIRKQLCDGTVSWLETHSQILPAIVKNLDEATKCANLKDWCDKYNKEITSIRLEREQNFKRVEALKKDNIFKKINSFFEYIDQLEKLEIALPDYDALVNILKILSPDNSVLKTDSLPQAGNESIVKTSIDNDVATEQVLPLKIDIQNEAPIVVPQSEYDYSDTLTEDISSAFLIELNKFWTTLTNETKATFSKNSSDKMSWKISGDTETKLMKIFSIINPQSSFNKAMKTLKNKIASWKAEDVLAIINERSKLQEYSNKNILQAVYSGTIAQYLERICAFVEILNKKDLKYLMGFAHFSRFALL